MNSNIQFLVVDLFCGAGGTTEGFEQSGVAKVIICINHDANAIASHKANHPNCHHFVEDIRTVNILSLLPLIRVQQEKYPHAKLVVWASAECTNFSDAKGGLPRNADSRSLPNHLEHYVEILKPHYLMVENVREFMAWGDLDEHGKPISRKKGLLYLKWVKNIQRIGYDYDYKILNAADFGAFQSRERYFGIFAQSGLPINFPKPTHSKNGKNGLQPYKAVKEVLDLHDIGNSIFCRKKPLVDKTLTRILRGLQKYKNEATQLIMHQYTPGYCSPITTVSGTVKTKDSQSIITPLFLKGYYGNPDTNARVKSLNEVGPTVVTHGRYGMCSIMRHYGSLNKDQGVASINAVAPTVTSTGTCSVISFLDRYFGNSTPMSIESPCGTLMTKDKTALAQFIYNPQFENKGNSINCPAPTVVAIQGKKPLGLATALFDTLPQQLLDAESDTDVMRQLKQYCRDNGITDVFLRMLNQGELLRIQGFPSDYALIGNAAQCKKMIGNAVEVNMAKALAIGLTTPFKKHHKKNIYDEYEYGGLFAQTA